MRVSFSSMALCDYKPINLEENTETVTLSYCVISLVTIGLQTRTQSEGSGLSCCLCPKIAPKFKGGCQSRSQQSAVWERDYVCACVHGQKMGSHSNRQLASMAVNS